MFNVLQARVQCAEVVVDELVGHTKEQDASLSFDAHAKPRGVAIEIVCPLDLLTVERSFKIRDDGLHVVDGSHSENPSAVAAVPELSKDRHLSCSEEYMTCGQSALVNGSPAAYSRRRSIEVDPFRGIKRFRDQRGELELQVCGERITRLEMTVGFHAD